jgi:hypothetical protein
LSEVDRGVRERLEKSAEGLVYTSESDRPFEFFSLGRLARGVLDKKSFAELVGASPGEIEERTLDDFLMRHIETSDPHDTRAQEIRPRYEAFKQVLLKELRDVRVYRIGRVEVSCYMVGIDRLGNACGLKTIAIET